MREARTPPDPAPMVKRSKSYWGSDAMAVTETAAWGAGGGRGGTQGDLAGEARAGGGLGRAGRSAGGCGCCRELSGVLKAISQAPTCRAGGRRRQWPGERSQIGTPRGRRAAAGAGGAPASEVTLPTRNVGEESQGSPRTARERLARGADAVERKDKPAADTRFPRLSRGRTGGTGVMHAGWRLQASSGDALPQMSPVGRSGTNPHRASGPGLRESGSCRRSVSWQRLCRASIA